jgi:hypothetical protein
MDIPALVHRAQQLKAKRQNFDSMWQRIADYMIPSREFTRHTTAGARRTPLIFNTTPILANEQLAGALHGMLTSPALRWFKVKLAGSTNLAGVQAVTQWFDAVTDIMYDHFQSTAAAFDVTMHEGYLDIAAFGTDVTFIADEGRAGPRYEAVPLRECYVRQNRKGVIDTLFRIYRMSVREIMAEWPETVSDATKRLSNSDPDAEVELLHAVYPRPPGEKGKPFVSRYVEMNNKSELETKQFEEFPYVVSRWSKRSGEDYGTGPGLNALPDVKLLNKLEEINLRGLAKVVDPPLVLPDDGFLAPIDINPGAHNFLRSDTMNAERIGPLVTGARPDLGDQKIGQVEKRINALFYLTWMNLPVQPNMTATEVLQRRDEMLRLMSPMVARLQTERLGPLITRSFNIMWRNGMFPQPPPELANAGWTIEYLGPLAMAQRANDAESALRWMQSIAMMAQLDPAVVVVIDTDAMARFLGDRQGTPATLMRAAEVVAQLRQQREQRQQQAEQLAGAQQAAMAAKHGASAVQSLAGAGMDMSGAGGAGQAGGGQQQQAAA